MKYKKGDLVEYWSDGSLIAPRRQIESGTVGIVVCTTIKSESSASRLGFTLDIYFQDGTRRIYQPDAPCVRKIKNEI